MEKRYIKQSPGVGVQRELNDAEKEHVVCLLRAIEQLPTISELDVNNEKSDSSYDVLCRRLEEIHHNHLKLAEYASVVLVEQNCE